MNTKIFKTVCLGGLLAVGFTSCDDQIMEWGTPDGRGAVTAAEIPLEVKEVLANYETLKTYSQQYMGNTKLGLGIGAAIYTNAEDARSSLAKTNFEMITLGNAMKHDAVVGNSGSLNFTTIDNVVKNLKADNLALYGHNFFWYQQTNQTYLKSLIKPTLVIESDSNIKSVLGGDDADFNGGTTGGWGSWGSNKESVEVVAGAGQDGSPAVVLTNKGDGYAWEAQFAYTFDVPLDMNTEYTIRFKAKSNTASGQLQFQYQNSQTYSDQGGYNTFDIGTSWATYEFAFTPAYATDDRIIFNFGAVGGSYTIDDIEFGEQQDNSMNLLVSSDFESGDTQGWGSWGSNKEDAAVVDGEGVKGSKALMLKNKGDGNAWEAQLAYTFDTPLSSTTEYTIRFQAKSASGKGQLQFQYQNSSNYNDQGGYNTFDIGSSYQQYEYSFTPAYETDDRIIFNFGAVGDTYYIDNIEFGVMAASDPMDNVLIGAASDFEGVEEGQLGGWGSWGSNKKEARVEAGAGHSGAGIVLENNGDGNSWEAQFAYTFDEPLQMGKQYIIQFWAKSSSAAGQLQFQYQNSSNYGDQGGYNTFDVGTDWMQYEFQFSPAYETDDRIIFNFGTVGATYYIDDVKFGLAKDQSAPEVRQPTRGQSKARSYYVVKSDAEKYDALVGAMESWVKGMADHLAAQEIVPYGYDVINEAIADGQGNGVRGVDKTVFGGSTDGVYDAAPVEDETGLELNWGGNRFYWGYYVPDYGVKAFQFARKYLPAETKLFINDYNLETSPSKLAALIKWVGEIDAANGSAIVDGIGTQMHITLSGTSDDADNNAQKIANLKAQVDAMFKTMAATGKLVRVTELDIALGTSSPSAAQYKAQADAYRIVFESFKANVPAAQQSGITIWGLSDATDEHEYWLNGEMPNLFDGQYLRKWAYKGAADGIADEDLGLQFGGEDYKAYYEKQNVSSTVQ